MADKDEEPCSCKPRVPKAVKEWDRIDRKLGGRGIPGGPY